LLANVVFGDLRAMYWLKLRLMAKLNFRVEGTDDAQVVQAILEL
jgi:hypothetical protein